MGHLKKRNITYAKPSRRPFGKRKGHATAFNLARDIRGEAHVERAFGIGVSALAETLAALSQALV